MVGRSSKRPETRCHSKAPASCPHARSSAMALCCCRRCGRSQNGRRRGDTRRAWSTWSGCIAARGRHGTSLTSCAKKDRRSSTSRRGPSRTTPLHIIGWLSRRKMRTAGWRRRDGYRNSGLTAETAWKWTRIALLRPRSTHRATGWALSLATGSGAMLNRRNSQ